jgi:hypothetical protein
VSMTGFVLSLTCCLSLVGAIFGLVGLGRTKPGRHRGRWAAVSAIVIGFVFTLATAGLITIGVLVDEPVDELEVGDCFDASGLDERGDTDDVTGIVETSCDDEHEAEVLVRETLGDEMVDDLRADSARLCNQLLDDEGWDAQQARRDGIVVPITATSSPDAGDILLCVIAAKDDVTTDGDDPFTEPYDQDE